jgi:hypothetical protein
MFRFILLVERALFDKVSDMLFQMRPIKVQLDPLISCSFSRMSSQSRIMKIAEQLVL